jgi:hypothetical protein
MKGAEIVSCKILFLDLIQAVLVLENIPGSQFGISMFPVHLVTWVYLACVCVFPQLAFKAIN